MCDELRSPTKHVTLDPSQLTQRTPNTKATVSCRVEADGVIATGWLTQFFLHLSEFTVTKLLDSDAKIPRLKMIN